MSTFLVHKRRERICLEQADEKSALTLLANGANFRSSFKFMSGEASAEIRVRFAELLVKG